MNQERWLWLALVTMAFAGILSVLLGSPIIPRRRFWSSVQGRRKGNR